MRELLATARAQPGNVMFAWLMTVGDHLALIGPACMIPRQHCEGVHAAIEAELARGFAPAPADTPRSVTYDASHAPAPDEWLVIGDPPKRAAIEAHHRALWVTAPPIHTELHLVVENQLAAGDPPEARATLERLVEEGLDRHEAIHAVGSVVVTALWDITRLEAPIDRDAMARSLADLRASDWRGESAESPEPSAAPSDQIPPLAHEVMYGLVLGFREAIRARAGSSRTGEVLPSPTSSSASTS